ncbi:hypothetical protein G6553_20355 [Nocardioides sp. IC4_145]|uniref:hypothetical protein n=1 Tax=Nocardioides sp. IC4_145 TaxID=2714037 RepID=UPI00140B128E|nr:hypothetical protein [Nocardioides sp. IC4_145]NHC25517.1 hypothetical protein [Nocardioides sp. IC4_145]
MTRTRVAAVAALVPLSLLPVTPSVAAPATAAEPAEATPASVAATDPKGDVTGTAKAWLVRATDVRKVEVEVALEPELEGDDERDLVLSFIIRHGRSLLGKENAHAAVTWFAVGKRAYKAVYGSPGTGRMDILRKNAEGEWNPVFFGFASQGAGGGRLDFSVPVGPVGAGELKVRQTVLRLRGTDVRDTVAAPKGSITLE